MVFDIGNNAPASGIYGSQPVLFHPCAVQGWKIMEYQDKSWSAEFYWVDPEGSASDSGFDSVDLANQDAVRQDAEDSDEGYRQAMEEAGIPEKTGCFGCGTTQSAVLDGYCGVCYDALPGG